MTAPRTLAEIPGLIFRGTLPDFAGPLFGGTAVYVLGPLMFVLLDATRHPEAARPGIELENVALVTGECPECGGMRPALAAPPGVSSVMFPPDPHKPTCPASEGAIARALENPHPKGDPA